MLARNWSAVTFLASHNSITFFTGEKGIKRKQKQKKKTLQKRFSFYFYRSIVKTSMIALSASPRLLLGGELIAEKTKGSKVSLVRGERGKG